MTDQYTRLAAFRHDHPDVTIGRAHPAAAGWDATVPLPRDGKGYYAPRPLADLLDVLEEELGGGAPP